MQAYNRHISHATDSLGSKERVQVQILWGSPILAPYGHHLKKVSKFEILSIFAPIKILKLVTSKIKKNYFFRKVWTLVPILHKYLKNRPKNEKVMADQKFRTQNVQKC